MKLASIFLLAFFAITARADWSESYGGDGVVSEFKIIARILLQEMKSNPLYFSSQFTQALEKEIDETIVTSSADPLILDGIEKDAINHTLVRPYKIEVSTKKWLQYESSFDTQARLVLHEFLFTLHIDDSDYLKSANLYRTILSARMLKNDRNRLGPLFLQASASCQPVRVANLLSLGVDPNYRDEENRNALFMAASAGCEELVSQFISMEIFSLKTKTNSWDPLYAAFLGSLRSDNNPQLITQYSNIIEKIEKYYFNVDQNIDAKFSSEDFPFQLSVCDGQTMFMRSLIGLYFYSDDTKSDIQFVRNLKIAGLLKKLGASLDHADACGKTARDYAKLYGIDLDRI